MNRSLFAMLVVAGLFAIIFAPAVQGSTVQVDSVFIAKPDGAVQYSDLVNFANGTDYNRTSYNVTWKPFFANNSDSRGITLTPLTPPAIIIQSAESVEVVQRIRFSPDDLMDGVSVSLWRAPIGNVTSNADVVLRIWRVDSIPMNVTNVDGNPVFTGVGVEQIWNDTITPFAPTAGHPTRVRYQTVQVSENASYKFVYAFVRAPLFPNKDYFAYWNVSSDGTRDYHLYFTSGDIGNDGVYGSWYNLNNAPASTYIPVDLDMSIVMMRGMANGIAGLALGCAAYNVTCLFAPQVVYDRTVPNTVVTNGPTYTYANLVMPVVTSNLSTGVDAEIVLTVVHTLGFYTFSFVAVKWNATKSLLINSWNLSAVPGLVGKTVTSLTFEFEILNEQSHFYLSASNIDEEAQIIFIPASGFLLLRFHFTIFGFFSLNNFFYENTEKDIELVLIEEPASDLEILQAWQRWQVSIEPENPSPDLIGCVKNFVFGFLGYTSEGPLTTLLLQSECIIQGVINGVVWLARTIYQTLVQFFDPLIDWLWAVGNWIWQALSFVVRAIEWFIFWAVKLVNTFIVGVVFSIMFLSVNYVGKGFYTFIRTGYDAEEMRAVMRFGWERVWSLIQLLLSLALLAISAISAVVPL